QLHCRFTSELHREPHGQSVPLSSEDVTPDMAELVDEAFVSGVLANELPATLDRIEATIEPLFTQEPRVDRIKVRLQAGLNGSTVEHSVEFSSGRWNRTRSPRILQLREEATLGKDESAYHALVALPSRKPVDLEPPLLQPPPIIDGTLEQFGVRELGAGELVPNRPILINARLEADSIAACVAAGAQETGGAALGVILRLPEPLPNTSTPIVTLLTAYLTDHRHTGSVNEWSISPAALSDAAQIAEMRGMGESILTVIHSHGWSAACGKCNENADCPLAECTHVSLMDYRVLETLLPGKATLLPITGRRLGAESQQPVLVVHAWRGGEMRPLRFLRYAD
ncbi:MAG: hypothetical protein AB7U20_23250, partial [Planctomycetaceae bacterium]